MDLHKYLTIVIPCKNEGDIVFKTLDLLNYQRGIQDVSVIVSDNSDDGTKEKLQNRTGDKFNLQIIGGGYPSVGRNNGAKLTTTPYILFLDADIFILDVNLLSKVTREIIEKDGHLLTTKFQSTNGKYNLAFNSFYKQQKLIKPFEPFALGGFMLMNTEAFWKQGGFDEEVLVAEDYQLSRKIKSKKFILHNGVVFTTPRRFENKGMFYMIKLMVTLFFNRNNKKYFKDGKGYWS
jgi:cellulose synthase/poly-beta-1,6-N-acetylglucosamine synthase-like glycosyltransferase